MIRTHRLTSADDAYVLYYDETNNIRRLLVTQDGLNVAEPMCFVLGGIAHRGPVRSLDMMALRTSLRLQPSVRELKLEHLGKGGFLQLLQSPRLTTFLRWLLNGGLFIHYSAVDPLYWSTVDIVDSILVDDELGPLRIHHALLKNDLYTVLRPDVSQVAALYRRHSYPNVGRRRVPFMNDLRDLLEARRSLLAPFNHQMLKGLIERGARDATLPYLEDEKSNVLIDSFVDFYVNRIALFKNAVHVLDVERTIQSRMTGYSLHDGGKPLQNYRFADSKEEPGIQISDPVAGLIGKFITYLMSTDEKTLRQERAALDPSQVDNLATLNALMERSNDETPAFLHYVLSLTDMNRAIVFLQGV